MESHLSYNVTQELDGKIALVTAHGVINLTTAVPVLNELWEDPRYNAAEFGIWDLADCGELPTFDEISRIARFVSKEKAGRGPSHVAWVYPKSNGKLLTKIFSGLEKLIDMRMGFFADIDSARDWANKRFSDTVT